MKRAQFLILLIFFATSTGAQQLDKQQANLEAVFLYNFTKYIDWNKNNSTTEFIIGVIGDSPITDALYDIAKTYTVNNKRILIKIFNKPSEITDCDILFISQNNPFSLESILKRVGQGVLTVSEQTGYARKGTAFNFVVIHNKLKFEANLKAISDAKLKAGSQLLKLASIVRSN